VRVCIFVALLVCSCSSVATAESKLPPVIAHWKLAGDTQDAGPNGLHGKNQGVKFDLSKPGPQHPVGVFGGKQESIVVPASPQLKLGTSDFSISLWVHTAQLLDDDLGDLLSKYDPVKRTGFHLTLRNNTGTTNSLANTRQLQFGIDQGSEPTWTDAGRPGKAILGFSMATHAGALYVGTCEGELDQAGHVYRYAGEQKWIDCGIPNKANSVSSLAAFEGRLYAGTAKYRLKGSALAESDNPNLGGQILCLDDSGKWTPCGQLPEAEGVGGMTVYKGRLYASSLYKPAGIFRYEGDGKWTSLTPPDGKRTVSLGVFNGNLWATSYDNGHIYRFDGETWTDTGATGDNTQNYSFADYQGHLCVGTWPSGKVYRLNAQNQWEDFGRLGAELEVMGMMIHNGNFYAGTLPLAEVYRLDGDREWTRLRQLDPTETKFRRVWTAAQYAGQVYWSALPTGHIFAMEAGKCVTYDRELPAGWRHIAAVKSGGTLKLYVDGQPVAKSTGFDPAKFDLSNEQPLRIGAGSGAHFNGRLSNIRLFGHSLTETEITLLAAEQLSDK
jgi:hypothetical protein